MKLCVIGLGKLGAPLAAVLASKGHDVTGIDRNAAFVEAVAGGRAPVQEPGLQDLIDGAGDRLTATTEFAVADSDISFVIVPTPSQADGAFSNQYVLEAVRRIGEALRGKSRYHVVSIVSTVMPGSCNGVIRAALEEASGRTCGADIGLCYNPEFIALGSVVRDLLKPDMVLLGASDTRAGDTLEAVYRSVTTAPVLRQSLIDAEIAKIALNAYVTMKISFANMLAELCEQSPGADAHQVARVLGHDSRIGAKYLTGALGYGGPCFPRDNAALQNFAGGLKVGAELPAATDAINRRQAERVARLAARHLAPGARAAILGLAYKPATPVVEESQGVMIAAALADSGVAVTVHDPLALESARAVLGARVAYAASMAEAVTGAGLVLIATPDAAFAGLDDLLAGRDVTVIDCWRSLKEGPRVIQLGRGPESMRR
jgi:UDPglucose 6-dehydrogenase